MKICFKTSNYTEFLALQEFLYKYGFTWFLNDKMIDTGSCGYIFLIGKQYATMQMENFHLNPLITDGYKEVSLKELGEYLRSIKNDH